jgi:uncharacterized protein (DUF1501 family)
MGSSRRAFLQQIGCGILGVAAFATGLERLYLAHALAASATGDYKALVCVFLLGGNDANNTVIPIDGSGDYAVVRGALTIPQSQLLPITPLGDGRTFGLHPSLGALHTLWDEGRLAVVANVGPLVEPVRRDQYQGRTAPLPYQLFSHPDQQAEWQTAYATGRIPTGWGGRIADGLGNDAAHLPTIASVAGVTLFTTGSTTSPLVLGSAPTPLNQTLALKRPGDIAGGSALRALLALGETDTSLLVREAADVDGRAIADSLALNSDPVLRTVFPNTSLGNQLKQAEKLMKLSLSLGVTRQIFFVSLGGFDTHTYQGAATGTQASLLKQVSDALGAFYAATIELGVASQVTTFTMSDFSRTFKPAGTGAATGSDHAWGSYQFVLGGSVTGKDFYGRPPTLALNGPDDTDGGAGAHGRWIPTTAVDQYAATLATWFGVASNALPTVFPNLGRFASPNLGFLP